MKKFLALALIACMLFSATVLAAETKLADMFTLFDFGSQSKANDIFKEIVLKNWETVYVEREVIEDSWVLTCAYIPEYTGDYMNEIPQLRMENVTNASYGVYKLECGWATYIPNGYDEAAGKWTFAEDAVWVGRNQFMKIRLKNMTENDRISIYVASEWYQDIANVIIEISPNDTEFKTYIIDMAENCVKYDEGGNHKEFIRRSMWSHPNEYNTERIYILLFGSYAFERYVQEGDITYMNIQVGWTVDLDYIIFAPTAEMAQGYTSYHEEGKITDEATTTSEETTTTSEETTTTTEETTTTVSEETTTTVSEETTTTVSQETTTTVSEETTTASTPASTTTVANDGGDDNGGFPVWIIIVIVVVICGGVAAFLVFKK